MVVKKEKESNIFDKMKWIVAVILLLTGLGANYYFLKIPTPLRALGWVVLLCVVLALIFQTVLGRKLWKFFQTARTEIKKVVWPTRKETFQTTMMVVAVVVVFALVLWGIDAILMRAVNWLTG